MTTDTLRQVFGTLRTPNGSAFPNKSLKWFRERRVTVAQGSSVVLDDPFIVATDAAGDIDTSVMAGTYLVLAPLSDADRYFRVVVPDQAGPFDISSLIDGPTVEPDDLTQFEALVAKAKAWANAPEDSAVEGGEFSAKHYAAKAATALDASIAKAAEWAENPEDVEVEAGQFSAKHWAAKSEDENLAAQVARTGAETAELNAETARDAAFVNANVYASTAAGLAATTTGQQFQVVSGDEIIRYRHDAGPVAVEVARYPAADYVSAFQTAFVPFEQFGVASQTIGHTPVSGSAGATNFTFIYSTPALKPSRVKQLRVWAQTAGAWKIKVFSAPSGGQVSLVSEAQVSLSVGLNTINIANGLQELVVPPGGLVGFYAPSSGGAQVAFATATPTTRYYAVSGDAAGTVTLPSLTTNIRLAIGLDFEYPAIARSEVDADFEADLAEASAVVTRLDNLTEEETQVIGYSPINGASVVAFGFTWIYSNAIANRAGRLKRVRFYATTTGTVVVKVFSKPSADSATVLASIPLTVTVSGDQVFDDLPPVFVPEGGLIGFYQATGIVRRSAGLSGANVYYPSGEATGTISLSPVQNIGQIHIDYELSVDTLPEKNLSAELAGKVSAAYSAIRLDRKTQWNGLILYGQSLAEGIQSAPAISLTQPYSNLTFGSGPRSGKAGSTSGALNTSPGVSTSKPLVEDDVSPTAAGYTDSPGETPCAGAANSAVKLAAIEEGVDPTDFVIFASCAARGASAISVLAKGATWYQQLLDHIQGQYDLAVAAGKSYALHAVCWMQGEGDTTGTTRAAYKAALVKLQADIEADAKAITGQTSPVVMLTYQTNSSGTLAGRVEIALAQYEAARDSGGKIVLAGPIYYLPKTDGVHLTNISSMRYGRILGRAYKQLVIENRTPDRLWPVSATAVGTSVTLRFDVPMLPLVFDTTEVAALTDYGFHLFDDTGDLILSGITISGSTVTMTVNRALGANPKLRYGTKYGLPSGNLRDSSDQTVTHGGTTYFLRHWAPAFELPVLAVEA